MKILSVDVEHWRVFPHIKSKNCPPSERDMVHCDDLQGGAKVMVGGYQRDWQYARPVAIHGGRVEVVVSVIKSGVQIRAGAVATCSLSDEFMLETGVKLAARRIAHALGLRGDGQEWFVCEVWDKVAKC